MTEEVEPWRFYRQPFRQTIAKDGVNNTHARSCTKCLDYVLVRVPVDQDGNEQLDGLTEEERRFVVDNITPKEFDALNGEELPVIDWTR